MDVVYTIEKYENDSWVVIVTTKTFSDSVSWYKAVERAHPYENYRVQKRVTYITEVTPT